MNRVDALARRYAASASLARSGVEVIAVGDPHGGAFDQAVRRLLAETRREEVGLWDGLVGASKALRWRRLTQPQPVHLNRALAEGYEQLSHEIVRLQGAVAFDSVLDALATSSAALVSHDSPLGGLVARCIDEVGADQCAVVASSRAAQSGIQDWLGSSQVQVILPSNLEEELRDIDLVYAIGPPRCFPSSMVTAPVADEVTFVMPTWFGDVSVPRSLISAYAEGAVLVRARISREGDDQPAPMRTTTPAIEEGDLLPAPLWGSNRSQRRRAGIGEVEARKVLLAGDLALWLDDGDRIRAVDPRQPRGERVIYVDVDEVGVGTYLLVRSGNTERSALYERALNLLGPLGPAIDHSQTTWKLLLSERLAAVGYRKVVRALVPAGVRTADRAPAWTDPNLIRPNRDSDFEALLSWLGLAIEPTMSHANRLRRALYQASADVREELESAVSRADLDALERDGSLNLEFETDGFRGILATRVLAISTVTEIVHRREARVAFDDRSARWLE